MAHSCLLYNWFSLTLHRSIRDNWSFQHHNPVNEWEVCLTSSTAKRSAFHPQNCEWTGFITPQASIGDNAMQNQEIIIVKVASSISPVGNEEGIYFCVLLVSVSQDESRIRVQIFLHHKTSLRRKIWHGQEILLRSRINQDRQVTCCWLSRRSDWMNWFVTSS